ncbi:Flagellar basal-body rod protein FlgG [hydrothermal vent metagenome]|uniref:Flagellar basal-body rod protein FlgG n=1 Tax=hydrothermal vent metagenome TaxID=652676 RepID=A0A1W1CY11_9ZZZZ
MQTGYYSAAAGMVTQFNRLNVIANNLANVNTAGFKQDNLIFGDYMRLYKETRDELPHDNNTREGAKFINRTMDRVPQIVDKYTDFAVGSLQKTGNSLDIALSREGLFFAVKTPQGIRLTRDGSFSMNDEGKLVNREGYEVLPNDYFTSKQGISFSNTDSAIRVDKNGQITTNIPGSVKFTSNKKIMVLQPENIKMLKKEGNNLYNFGGLSNIKSIDDSGAVMQGFIEKSNVNAVKMMTQLIQTNRLVGMYQKVMDTQMNDMNKDAIEKLASKS